MAQKRYWFALLDEDYNEMDAFIPDGSNKKTAVNYAKRWMKNNGVKSALLYVNSMITDNFLDYFRIEIAD